MAAVGTSGLDSALPEATQLRTLAGSPIVCFMERENKHFERFGIAYMPCTVAGWGYLFAFVAATLVSVFLVQAIWTKTGWQGGDAVQAAILVVGVLGMVRFAHSRSK